MRVIRADARGPIARARGWGDHGAQAFSCHADGRCPPGRLRGKRDHRQSGAEPVAERARRCVHSSRTDHRTHAVPHPDADRDARADRDADADPEADADAQTLHPAPAPRQGPGRVGYFLVSYSDDGNRKADQALFKKIWKTFRRT
jgi:hypothetical protein